MSHRESGTPGPAIVHGSMNQAPRVEITTASRRIRPLTERVLGMRDNRRARFVTC